MFLSILAAAALLQAAPEPAAAAPAATPPAELGPVAQRLSQEEIDRILDEAENRELSDPEAGKLHGEFGVTVGTGGGRSILGSAYLPLGEDGVAAVAFEATRFPRFDPDGWRERRTRR